MKEHDRLMATSLVGLILLFWAGFLFHRSPDFAGSFAGGMLAVSGSLLMLVVSVGYLIIKRIKPIRRRITPLVPLQTLLVWHIYASVLGTMLVVLHTGHKFQSPLGIALTAITLLVVLSGYAGHYLMKQCSQTLREKREVLTQLEIAYRWVAGELVAAPEQVSMLRGLSGFFSQWNASPAAWQGNGGVNTAREVMALVGAMADVEHSVKMHASFEVALKWCLKLHITFAISFYALLTLHVWSGIYFGLRWFP